MAMKHGSGVVIVCAFALSACAGNPLPPANGVQATFDPATQAIQVIVSNAQAPYGAALVSDDGTHYPVTLTLVSSPHVNYSAPPSIGLGLGGFGGDVGGGLGFGVPLGGPRPTGVDDQYVASAKFGVPPDYSQRWASYRVEVHVGPQAIQVAAPSPTRS